MITLEQMRATGRIEMTNEQVAEMFGVDVEMYDELGESVLRYGDYVINVMHDGGYQVVAPQADGYVGESLEDAEANLYENFGYDMM